MTMTATVTETGKRSLPNMPGDVLDRCRQGDIAAFEQVYQLFKRPMYSLAYNFHGNRFDAEDSVQDAFIAMYRGIHSFKGDSAFGTWLYRILLNACINRKRRERHFEEHADYASEHMHPSDPDRPDVDVILRDTLQREIATLPALQRAVFLLFATEGFTHPEIADTLKIPVGTSKSHYHRAKEELKKRLSRLGIKQREMHG